MGWETGIHSRNKSQVWVFKRNCSLTPRQLLSWYGSLCFVTLSIATGFLIAGYWIVLPFAGIELSLVALAFFIYGRHAGDFEMVEVDSIRLRVTLCHGSKTEHIDLVTQWTKLEYRGRFREPLVLKSEGKQVSLGRFIAEKDKPDFQRDLKLALAHAVSPV